MNIDLIFKIAGTGIIVAVLNLVLKRAEREEQAMMTTLAGLIVVLVIIVQEIGGLFDTVKTVFKPLILVNFFLKIPPKLIKLLPLLHTLLTKQLN